MFQPGETIVAVGMRFRGNHNFKNDAYMLKREPKNRYDPNAIKIVHVKSNTHVAYVSRDTQAYAQCNKIYRPVFRESDLAVRLGISHAVEDTVTNAKRQIKRREKRFVPPPTRRSARLAEARKE